MDRMALCDSIVCLWGIYKLRVPLVGAPSSLTLKKHHYELLSPYWGRGRMNSPLRGVLSTKPLRLTLDSNGILVPLLPFVVTVKPSYGRNTELFGVDDSLVDGIPTGSGDAPVVGGVLIAVDSYLTSFDFFVSVDTHDAIFFLYLTS